MSKRFLIHDEQKPCYEIVIERDYEKLLEELEKLSISNRRLCIVTETTVGPLYAEKIKQQLLPYAELVTIFTFQAGEASKNLDTVQDLYEFLIQNQFDRLDMLLALGGGVVGDLTGYAAATYLRGIDFVQLPTSLLSQVDSSIGGKTGVDLKAYKNMVGAFYQPKLVYMNLNVLKSLPEREYLSGMGEIIKHGLIKDRSYYDWIAKHVVDIRARDLDALEFLIQRSCEIKQDVVERDPKEKGDRALLNFGHTLGHAVERIKNFHLLHGECVCIGMNVAMLISKARKSITEEEYRNFRKLLSDFSLPDKTDEISIDEILLVSKNDKKMEHGIIKFILLREIGNAYIDRTVTEEEMNTALLQILSQESNFIR